MTSRPAFQRRFLFGYEPIQVDRALAGYRQRLDDLAQELSSTQAQLRERTAELTAAVETKAELGDLQFSLPRRLFGYRRDVVDLAISDLQDAVTRERRANAALTTRAEAAEAELATWHERQEQMEALATRAAEEAARVEAEAAEDARRVVLGARASATAIIADARTDAAKRIADADTELEQRREQLRAVVELHDQLTHGIQHAMSGFERQLAELPHARAAIAAGDDEPDS
jgi:hypothetical protein